MLKLMTNFYFLCWLLFILLIYIFGPKMATFGVGVRKIKILIQLNNCYFLPFNFDVFFLSDFGLRVFFWLFGAYLISPGILGCGRFLVVFFKTHSPKKKFRLDLSLRKTTVKNSKTISSKVRNILGFSFLSSLSRVSIPRCFPSVGQSVC